jgi:VWFA-related protein
VRRILAGAAILGALGTQSGAQDSQPPAQRFRSGVDLITVDVTVLDRHGRTVAGLTPGDFRVRVDGREREVVSAELIRVGTPSPQPSSAVDALITTNATVPGSRRVAIAVDQTLIAPAAITPLIQTASSFVEALTPADHAAFLAFPEPGPRVDFTTDKARVRDAMKGIVGQPAKVITRTFNASLAESLAIHEKERVVVRTDAGDPAVVWRSVGPMMRRVLERGTCEQLTVEELRLPENIEILKKCLRDLGTEAMMHTLEVRQDATISLRRLESFLGELVPLEGPTSLVLISAGLVIEDLTLLNEAQRLASAARTAIHVIAVDPTRDQAETITGLPHGQSPLALVDRQLELTGLERVADLTGGTFVRAIGGNGEGIFDRLATELSAWYVVAVERQPEDPDRQRIQVEVRRRGVDVRSSRMFVASAAIDAARPAQDVLRDALSSPISIPGLPIRVATFVQRDAASERLRLHVAAEIGPPGTTAGEFSVGLVVLNAQNSVVASVGRQLQLAPDSGPDAALPFDTAVALDPGEYSLRFGAVHRDGRRGTVVRNVSLTREADAVLSTSDLIVGSAPPDGGVMHPRVEPRVEGRIAGYLEIYSPPADAGALTVELEIAEGEASPALTTTRLNIGAAPRPQWRAATGAIDAALLPGRYVARANVRRNGETVHVLTRPFVLERPVARPPTGDRERIAPVSPEALRRTASYVEGVVGGLANVVAEEAFALTDPDRRITSDFLLVRYPGSERDLLTYRDVIQVNGSEVPNRGERLTELFVRPMITIRDRVNQITLAAASHVPPVLNPIYVLAFLQPDFQPRFEFRTVDGGSEWPAEVKVVAFEEIGRPTLLRAGPLGDLDLPSRGRVWIEETTGRILRTELQVTLGRSPTTVVTTFGIDERLQIMVPQLMRTQNPAGIATYGRFRRFTVATNTDIRP